MMLKFVLAVALVAMMAISSLSTATAATIAVLGMSAGSPGRASLDKTWTTQGQENGAGSQVHTFSRLASPGSSPAEGMGFEPTTGCPAPDFESVFSGYDQN